MSYIESTAFIRADAWGQKKFRRRLEPSKPLAEKVLGKRYTIRILRRKRNISVLISAFIGGTPQKQIYFYGRACIKQVIVADI